MKHDIAKRLDFRDKIFPDLEVLLKFSLWLTKNSRDATLLMREALAEAYQTWDKTSPEKGYVRLHGILTKKFSNRPKQELLPPAAITGQAGPASLPNVVQIVPIDEVVPRENSFLTGDLDDDADYLRAIACLPSGFRSAMILSYLDGFSRKEFTGLANVEPSVVDTWLDRGRTMLGSELFPHLLGDDSSHPIIEPAAVADETKSFTRSIS